MLNLVQSTKNRNVLYKTEIATKTNVNLWQVKIRNDVKNIESR